jgi:hypothetical protein
MQPLAQGVYFLKIFNDHEVIATEKLIKQ